MTLRLTEAIAEDRRLLVPLEKPIATFLPALSGEVRTSIHDV